MLRPQAQLAPPARPPGPDPRALPAPPGGARSSTGFSPYRYYGHGADEKQIDLAALTSQRLWSLLDEAADVGLELLPARHRLGPRRAATGTPRSPSTSPRDPTRVARHPPGPAVRGDRRPRTRRPAGRVPRRGHGPRRRARLGGGGTGPRLVPPAAGPARPPGSPSRLAGGAGRRRRRRAARRSSTGSGSASGGGWPSCAR